MLECVEKYHGNSKLHAMDLIRRKQRYQKKKEKLGIPSREVHGLYNTPTWWTWHFMKQRVLNPSNRDYQHYKNRSIEPRWMEFRNFYNDMGDRPKGMTLDRKDNDKGYFKDNCRWATLSQQARNRKKGDYSNKLSLSEVREIKASLGKTTQRELAEKYGVHCTTIGGIKHGRIWRWVVEVSHV
jgi:hypothetical protein